VKLLATGCEIGIQFSTGQDLLPSSPLHPDWPWGPPHLQSIGYRDCFPRGLKRWEREADHSS